MATSALKNSPELICELKDTYKNLLGLDVAESDIDDILQACRAAGVGDIVTSIFKDAGSVPGAMEKDGSVVKTVIYHAQRISRNYQLKQSVGPNKAITDKLGYVIALAVLALFLYPIFKTWQKKLVEKMNDLPRGTDKVTAE